MKAILIPLLSVTLLVMPHAKGGESEGKQPLQKVPSIAAAKGERILEIINNEARPDNDVIKEFVVKEYVTVSYKNTTNRTVTPKFTLRIYNHYGFLLAERKPPIMNIGGSPPLEPGEVGAEKLRIDWIQLEKIFAQSRYVVPDDFAQPKWISISLSNTKIEPAAADQPATPPGEKAPAEVQPSTQPSKVVPQ